MKRAPTAPRHAILFFYKNLHKETHHDTRWLSPLYTNRLRGHMTRVIDEIMAEAQMAEASGWDGCFISEHHQQADGDLPNPLLMAVW